MKTSLLVLGTAVLLAPILTVSAQSPAPSPTAAAAATPAASPAESPSPAKQHRHKKDATPAPGESPAGSPGAPGASPSSRAERHAAQEQRLAAMTPAPGGGPGMVWVNSKRHVYHMPGSKFYGKTKEGKYMTEDAAKAEGDHAAKNNE